MKAVGNLKLCPKCKSEKHIDSFTKDSKTSDGLDIWCRSCKSSYNQSPQAKESYNKWYYEGKGSAVKSSYQKEGKRRARHKAEPYRAQVLRRKYGITYNQYLDLIKKQDGKCAICGTAKPGRGRKEWPVDHDHKTNRVRGLLCSTCNSALGLFKDSIKLCKNAIIYLGGTV